MKNFDFNFRNCKSYEDIEAVIKKALKYEVVVDDDDSAEEYFRDCGYDCEVYHNTILSKRINIWNEEHQGEEVYGVAVWEHYFDSGSIDYVYSYNIVSL